MGGSVRLMIPSTGVEHRDLPACGDAQAGSIGRSEHLRYVVAAAPHRKVRPNKAGRPRKKTEACKDVSWQIGG